MALADLPAVAPAAAVSPAASASSAQCASHVLMIRPVRFLSNPETASSNAFQRAGPDPYTSQAAAYQQFNAYAAALRAVGVGVTVVDDTPEPHTPDSIFPNNWLSTDCEGRVYLYPMEAPNRRLERRMAVLAELDKQFAIAEIVDFGPHAAHARYLEGTGSIVLDRDRRIAYACHSSRTHPAAMRDFEERTGYRAHWFHALDRRGKPIYHTNVMMSVGASLAVVCLDALPDTQERQALMRSLHAAGKEVIAIGIGQVEQFCGNMLELRGQDGKSVWAVSRRGWAALTAQQRARIGACSTPLIAQIDTIERLGGGSARCMVAEIFLPPN